MKIFLHKSLSKLLLLVVLFFGGCSAVDVVEADAIDTAKNKIGTYFNSDGDSQTFEISTNGLIYINYKIAETEVAVEDDEEAEIEEYTLGYASSGTNYIEYLGSYKDNDEKDIHVRVVLSNITGYTGMRIEYKKDISNKESEHESGFSWNNKSE